MRSTLPLALAFVATIAAAAPLPTGFIGHWHGVPEYTSTGPRLISSGGLNFTVHVIDDHHWLMEDSIGRAVSMKNSQQQFWIKSWDNHTTPGHMTYCGWLAGYYLTMPQHGKVFEMKMLKMTDRRMTFKYYGATMQDTARLWMPWDVEWWLDLSEDGQSMTMFIGLPWGPDYSVTHLRVNLTLMSKETLPHASPVARAVLAEKQLQPPCNFTAVPANHPMPPVAEEKQRAAAAAGEGLNYAGPEEARLACPHGFTEKDGAMPDFVKKAIQRRKMESRLLRNKKAHPEGTEAALTRQEHAEQKLLLEAQDRASKPTKYQYCIRLNAYHNLTIRLHINNSANATDVLVSGIPKAQAALNSWIAVGIMPAWPSMKGMDIILGHFDQSSMATAPKACVRSMFALNDTGLPIDNPKQKIYNGRVFTSGSGADEALNLAFTRPWKTGNWDLSEGPKFPKHYKFIPIPVAAWALGRAPAGNCSTAPLYHFSARGTHGFSWGDPTTAVIPQSWCDPRTEEEM